MAEFCTDIRDINFVLFEQCGLEQLFGYEKYQGLDRATLEAVLEEAYKFGKNQLAPMNSDGDSEGCTWDNKTGEVKVPKAFRDSYKLFAENGWASLAHSPEFGGQGMPYALTLAANDIFFGSCLSFCLHTLLTSGAAHLIEAFGTDEQKAHYVERMYTGTWAGTMCLTEAGAGSDVGACRTKATPEGDHYLIEGEKIFITFGDHDMNENIIHAVLARIEGAPKGTKGISLFIVPKIRTNPDGSLGEPNDVKCSGIEHKMGIHGSPTCSLVFGDEGKCEGYLLGRENKGMSEMFQMMNEARIQVGLQGSALANAAYQYALQFAKERIQSGDISRKIKGSVPIINHPDVKRMLLWQKAISEGTRSLLLKSAFFYDCSEAADDEAERAKYQGLVELFTPVCKAYASDMGFKSTEHSLQTLGGYGYIKEYPVEQYLRDNKIASIYEGTNGIQALDLVGRKMTRNPGAFQAVIGMMAEMSAKNADIAVLKTELGHLDSARDALLGAAMYFMEVGQKDPMIPLTNATPFLELMGEVTVGWLLLEQACIVYPKLVEVCKEAGVDLADPEALAKLCEDNVDAKFYDGKVKVAKFWANRVLAVAAAEAEVIKSGDQTVLEATL